MKESVASIVENLHEIGGCCRLSLLSFRSGPDKQPLLRSLTKDLQEMQLGLRGLETTGHCMTECRSSVVTTPCPPQTTNDKSSTNSAICKTVGGTSTNSDVVSRKAREKQPDTVFGAEI